MASRGVFTWADLLKLINGTNHQSNGIDETKLKQYIQASNGEGNDPLMKTIAGRLRSELQSLNAITSIKSNNVTKFRQEDKEQAEDEINTDVLNIADGMIGTAAAMRSTIKNDICSLNETSAIQDHSIGTIGDANASASQMFGGWSWTLLTDIFYVSSAAVVFGITTTTIISTFAYAARHSWLTWSLEGMILLVSLACIALASYGIWFSKV